MIIAKDKSVGFVEIRLKRHQMHELNAVRWCVVLQRRLHEPPRQTEPAVFRQTVNADNIASAELDVAHARRQIDDLQACRQRVTNRRHQTFHSAEILAEIPALERLAIVKTVVPDLLQRRTVRLSGRSDRQLVHLSAPPYISQPDTADNSSSSHDAALQGPCPPRG